MKLRRRRALEVVSIFTYRTFFDCLNLCLYIYIFFLLNLFRLCMIFLRCCTTMSVVTGVMQNDCFAIVFFYAFGAVVVTKVVKDSRFRIWCFYFFFSLYPYLCVCCSFWLLRNPEKEVTFSRITSCFFFPFYQ